MRAYPVPDQEAVVRQVALEEGVDPNLLVSVWEQESGKSIDPSMTGPVLPQGHKYAGHYARGPFQIMSFHGPISNDFKGQVRWAAKHLKERGVRGYYGTGKPPPGFPTTDEYEQQVMARVPGAGMLAQAGVSDVPQGLGRQPQGPGFQQAPRAPGAQAMPQRQAQMDGLLSNPYLLLGASILAANDSKNTGQVLGRGLLGGMAAYERGQEGLALREQRQQQAEAQRMRQAMALRQQQAWDALMSGQGGGGEGGQSGGGALDGLAQYAVASQDPDLLAKVMGLRMEAQKALLPYGATTMADQQRIEISRQEQALRERQAADEGLPPSGPMAPGLAPPATPEQQIISNKAWREAAAEGMKAESKKRAEARVDLPRAEATAAQTLKTIDDLMAHPGRTWATGSFVGRLPALPGDAYDFKTKLDMAKGQVFLRAYETLKGGGQITQIEGEKAEKAMAALDRAQSEEAFLQGLKDLREAVEAGQRKLREAAGLQGGMEEAPTGSVDFRFENGRLVPAR